MIFKLSIARQDDHIGSGYIAGTNDGIVTAGGKPASREIRLYLADGFSLEFVRRTWSNDGGHYIFKSINPNKRYLVMCRDHERQYEPFCWDYVRPATDLTFAEQLALWQSWQS